MLRNCYTKRAYHTLPPELVLHVDAKNMPVGSRGGIYFQTQQLALHLSAQNKLYPGCGGV